jgi:hypothetical protein
MIPQWGKGCTVRNCDDAPIESVSLGEESPQSQTTTPKKTTDPSSRTRTSSGGMDTIHAMVTKDCSAPESSLKLAKGHARGCFSRPSMPGIVTVGPKNRSPGQLPLFCHHSPVKLREIRGNQMNSRTAQVIGWQEDLFKFLALAEALRSV